MVSNFNGVSVLSNKKRNIEIQEPKAREYFIGGHEGTNCQDWRANHATAFEKVKTRSMCGFKSLQNCGKSVGTR